MKRVDRGGFSLEAAVEGSAETSRPAPLRCRSALLLQGPAGPFFGRFAAELRSYGARTTKVHFHGGDAIYYRGGDVLFYCGDAASWPAYVRGVMQEREVDAIFVFGDCRPLHREAIAAAYERGAAVWVFEEGYLRPDFITLEADGVNGHSRLPRDPEAYRHALRELPAPAEPERGLPSYGRLAWESLFCSLAFTFSKPLFWRYQHHRPLDAASHTFWGIRNMVRKYLFRFTERHRLEEILARFDGRYFFVPLQVHCDFQLVHSPYACVEDFMVEVVESFAQYGRPDEAIVLKHHPMDRAYRDYERFFRELARRTGLGDRLYYVHDVDLPSLIDHSRGTVTINSTVGLSSIERGTPAKVMGTAIYNLPGLTFQGSLEEFWRAPGTFDPELLEGFRRYLRIHNQANGNFWRRLPSVPEGAGVRWFRAR